MFRKVLVLAVVCLAATKVRGNDSPCEIEKALEESKVIFNKLSSAIHGTITTYRKDYIDFYVKCDISRNVMQRYLNEEMREVKNASLELKQMAGEQNSPKSVFICISKKTGEAIEMLKSIPRTFNAKLRGEADRFKNDHYQIVDIAYTYMKTYTSDYRGNIVKSLKECETNECLEEILTKYEDEYKQKSEVLAGVVEKLNAHAEEFKDVVESTLSDAKESLTSARIAGVDKMKECMTLSD